MNSPTPPDPSDTPDATDALPSPVKTEYKFSHVTTQRYLPTPGKAPGWPFAEIGHWKIDVNATSQDWISELRDWRRASVSTTRTIAARNCSGRSAISCMPR